MTKVIKCKKTKTHFFGHKLFTKSNETKVFVNLGVSQALRSLCSTTVCCGCLRKKCIRLKITIVIVQIIWIIDTFH